MKQASLAGTQPAVRPRSALAALALPLCLAACASGSASTQGIYDPFEPTNRAVHALNKGLDRALVSPGANAYGVVPEPVRQSLSNLADTLSLPGSFANHLLQGNVEGAGRNAAQFAVNAVFGLGGLLDVATEAGIPRDKTDFGETLHVWGVGEGPYVELPILGPSTARDAVGEVVDIVLDPLNGVFEGDDAVAVRVLKALSRLNDRKRYSNTVDSILYDSADSYAQARLLYLQNRRFELGETSGDTGSGAGDDGFIDPYEDPYGQ
jgi:phospholipid-binding lipoprotein MlaA